MTDGQGFLWDIGDSNMADENIRFVCHFFPRSYDTYLSDIQQNKIIPDFLGRFSLIVQACTHLEVSLNTSLDRVAWTLQAIMQTLETS